MPKPLGTFSVLFFSVTLSFVFVAVGLDAARGGRAHFNTLEREARVVILVRAAHRGRDQTHELRADDLAVLHRHDAFGRS